MDAGRHDQRWIGDAAGDHDVRPAGERLDDRRRAEIRIGRHKPVADIADRGARIEIAKLGDDASRPQRERSPARRRP